MSDDGNAPCAPSATQRAILSLQLMQSVRAPRPGFNRHAPRV
jgi:hypothetical protein